MRVTRSQLKRKFIRAINEAYGFGSGSFDDKTEEMIGWNDPERDEKVQKYRESGREDYVVQNLDNLDPEYMTQDDRVTYVNKMADQLVSNTVEKSKIAADLKAKRDEEALDDFIARIKSGEISGRNSMSLAQIVDNYYGSDNAVSPYGEDDDTVVDPVNLDTVTSGFDQFGR